MPSSSPAMSYVLNGRQHLPHIQCRTRKRFTDNKMRPCASSTIPGLLFGKAVSSLLTLPCYAVISRISKNNRLRFRILFKRLSNLQIVTVPAVFVPLSHLGVINTGLAPVSSIAWKTDLCALRCTITISPHYTLHRPSPSSQQSNHSQEKNFYPNHTMQ